MKNFHSAFIKMHMKDDEMKRYCLIHYITCFIMKILSILKVYLIKSKIIMLFFVKTYRFLKFVKKKTSFSRLPTICLNMNLIFLMKSVNEVNKYYIL